MLTLAAWLAWSGSARASSNVVDDLILFNDNAAWSWFEDERAIVDVANGKILVSSVANAAGLGGGTRNGDVDVAALDLSSGTVSRFVLRAGLQADDHNSAALWQRPIDGRYVAMYGTHLADNLSRWRISSAAGSIGAWSSEDSLNNGAAMTYSNLYYLPNDNGGAGHLYNFVRADGFDPNILTSSNQGTTWVDAGRLLAEGGNSDRPYVRYFSDGARIHFITTERHPRDFDNSIYHGYIVNGQLFDSDGGLPIDFNLFDGTAVAPSALTQVFQTGTVAGGTAMRHAWTVDVATDNVGNPVAVFQARANNNTSDHRFFYGRWDGSQWIVNQMAHAGSFLYSAEDDYTGLVSINSDDVNTVYLSSEVHPATKAQLIGADGSRHYEVFRGTTSDGGANWSWTPITYNSTMDNVRPLVPKWNGVNTAILWMRGDYNTYQSYDMAAVGLVNPEIVMPNLALAVDIGATGQLIQSGFQAFTRAAVPTGNEQTELFSSSYASSGGQVAVTLGGGDVQFVDRGNDITGPIGDVADDFALVDGDLTLTFANLVEGNYQLVLYSHDRDASQLTANIKLNGVFVGVADPTTGVDPTIGISSSRAGFSYNGTSELVFTLDGIGAGSDVILNGFELYHLAGAALPLVDLNGDDDLSLADFQIYVEYMHTDLISLSPTEAFTRGDLNGDLQNNFSDLVIFRQAYDLWNGAGSFAADFAVPEPRTSVLVALGILSLGITTLRNRTKAQIALNRN